MKTNKNKLIGAIHLLQKEKKCLLMLFLTIFALIGNLTAQTPQIWPTEISFNYEGGSSNDALTIRKNASDTISVPEYVKDLRNESCAYIMDQSNRKIKVKFNSNNSNMNYLVKATDISGTGIGNVCEIFVASCDLNTTVFTITVSGVVPEGIDIRTFTWKWEATALPINAPYCPITCKAVNTTHTFYTLLDEPHAPISEPWTEVLDLCSWAYGMTTKPEAATMITEYLYNESGFNYVTDPRYGLDNTYFDLSNFLDDFGKGQSVNCLDMAKAVTTFANSIGCEMFLTIFNATSYVFPINCIDPIGKTLPTNSPLANTTYPGSIKNDCRQDGFQFHAFAQNRDSKIWDASLRYDKDGCPDNVNHSAPNDSCGNVVSGHDWESPLEVEEEEYLIKLIDDWVSWPGNWVNCNNRYDCGEIYQLEFIIQ